MRFNIYLLPTTGERPCGRAFGERLLDDWLKDVGWSTWLSPLGGKGTLPLFWRVGKRSHGKAASYLTFAPQKRHQEKSKGRVFEALRHLGFLTEEAEARRPGKEEAWRLGGFFGWLCRAKSVKTELTGTFSEMLTILMQSFWKVFVCLLGYPGFDLWPTATSFERILGLEYQEDV